MSFRFALTDAAANLGLRTLVWVEHDLNNQEQPAGLEELRAALLIEAQQHHAACIDILEGYRQLRARVGRSIKRFPPSPIALRGQFERRGTLVPISPVVDIYNLVSLVTGLSIGAHDLARIHGPVRLDLTSGHETFVPLSSALNEAHPRQVPAGEYAYIDAEDRVLCRLEYRQSSQSCLSSDSRDGLFIVQGHNATPCKLLQQVGERVSALLGHYCGSGRGEVWLHCRDRTAQQDTARQSPLGISGRSRTEPR
ncbi:phenylalanine--tRNA ligase beta subunit-related protein [Lamprobacter modestohalophilus]|uniref:B3/B4 domain-containing protein n=1 Tax=Lamprobacter modestohalophilus TaxID=1064514 RepID=UPI002ADEB911|nr:phenylalanine--tRNA ligase beta subunit-related protein [Lamprobacter modestohalophilus]MEA1049990.1 phenylalanine--tRNA ligase beta subunit-related protein [Lamprobacter modestohalophilus]